MDLPTSLAIIEEDSRNVNMFDLDVCEDKLILVPNYEFEVIQLGDNLTRSMKIRYGFPFEVKPILIEFLQENLYLFAITSLGMPDIDPTVACHQLNMTRHPSRLLVTKKAVPLRKDFQICI